MDHQSSGKATFNTFAAAFERLLQERGMATRTHTCECMPAYAHTHTYIDTEADSVQFGAEGDLMQMLLEDLKSRDSLLSLQRLSQALHRKDVLRVSTKNHG